METTVNTNVKGTPGRKGVTAQQVFGAADAILAKGTEPTNNEIQKMLGGSFSTISPLLRQWRDGKHLHAGLRMPTHHSNPQRRAREDANTREGDIMK